MTWVIERNVEGYYALKEGAGHLYQRERDGPLRLASHPWSDEIGDGVYYYYPKVYKSQEEAKLAIIDYEAKPIADEITLNARKTPFDPPAVAIEARIKEMVKENCERFKATMDALGG